MTYEENLRKTAEEISVVIFNCQYSGMTTNSKQECTELAEYCLKKQEDKFKEGFFHGWNYAKNPEKTGEYSCAEELKALGLIP